MSGDPGGRRPVRRVTVIIGSIAVAALALSSVWIMSGISKPTVTIVAIIPLTGASSYLVEIGDAMTMTADGLNKWGGIDGKHIRLVIVDCESSPQVALSKFIEAEEKYDPLAVITATREVAASMAVIAEERGVVLISVGASPEDLTVGNEWAFRYYIAPSKEADTALKTLNELNVDSLGILYMDDGYGRAVMTRMADEFLASNRTVETRGFSKDCTDFSEAVTDLADNEAVFAVGFRYQYPIILGELNSSGYEGYAICAIGGSIPTTWGLPDAQGCYVNAPTIYMPSATINQVFMTEFQSRYGRPLTHQGAIGSDVLRLIWGLLSDNEVSSENLRNQLEKGFVYSGILGVVTLNRGAHNIDVPIHRAVIEGGALTYL